MERFIGRAVGGLERWRRRRVSHEVAGLSPADAAPPKRCAKTEWFWRVSKVGQPGAEVPDLPCLTDPAGIGVIGSSSISDPVSHLHPKRRMKGRRGAHTSA